MPANNYNNTTTSNSSNTTKMSRTKEMIALPANFVPGPMHVICAKGKEAKQHAANRLLKSLVKAHLTEYSECPSKLERSFLVSKILKQIRQGDNDAGGFVRYLNGRWCDVGDRNAREKVGQMFRDLLHDQFKSSTKAKASIRRRQQQKQPLPATISSASLLSGSSSSSSSSSSSALSTQRANALSPVPSASVSMFPIREVTYSSTTTTATNTTTTHCVTPGSSLYCQQQHKKEVELDWRDLEPLPLTEAMVKEVDLESPWMTNMYKDDACFAEAMDEMYQCHFSDSSEDAFTF